MFSSIINCIIWAVGLGLIYYLTTFIPLPPPFGAIVTVLFIVLAIVVVLSLFGLVPFGVPRPWKG